MNKGKGDRVGQGGADGAGFGRESTGNRVWTAVLGAGPVNPLDRYAVQRTGCILQRGGQGHIHVAPADVGRAKHLPDLSLAEVSQAHCVPSHDTTRRDGQTEGGCRISRGELHGVAAAGQDVRRVIGALDAHGQGAGRGATVAVVDGVGKGVGQVFANRQCLHRCLGVVHRVGVTAVAGDIDFSIGAGDVGGDMGRLDTTDVARCNALHGQGVAVLIGIENAAAACARRYHVARHAGRVGRCQAFVD